MTLQMSREEEKLEIELHLEEIIQELETLYHRRFDGFCNLNLGERKIAKLTQLLLQSREGAIRPLIKGKEKEFSAHRSSYS